MPSQPTTNVRLSRSAYLGLGSIARLAAAFLFGALLCLAYYFYRISEPVVIPAVAAVVLWGFALLATRNLTIPGSSSLRLRSPVSF